MISFFSNTDNEQNRMGFVFHLHYLERVSLQAEERRGEQVLVGFLVVRVVHVAQLGLLLGRVGMKLHLLGPVSDQRVLLVQLREGAG